MQIGNKFTHSFTCCCEVRKIKHRKAIRCHVLGTPDKLVLEELDRPELGAKDVRIRIHACSVNYPDTLIIQGLYQFKPELPFSPVSDISGVVKAVGEGVKHVKVGDEVFGFITINSLLTMGFR